MIPNLKINIEKRERKGFNASDFGKMGLEIYYAFKQVEPTNPVHWSDTLKWGAGKGVELAMVQVLKDSGIVDNTFDQEKEEAYEMERNGLKIRMKIDAVTSKNELGLVEGAPIEIKSINNKNSWDIKKYADGNPRENYVGQLSIYLDYLAKDIGYLFVSSIDGLSYFWFECKRLHDRVYQCGNTIVDLDKEYDRWNKVKQCIDTNVEPDPFEAGRYKIPINEIDWTKVSVTDTSKARNGEKVIGDPEAWKISYSPWKDIIIKLQGIETAGYSEQEINQIIINTKGYSAKKK